MTAGGLGLIAASFSGPVDVPFQSGTATPSDPRFDQAFRVAYSSQMRSRRTSSSLGAAFGGVGLGFGALVLLAAESYD